MKPMKPKMIYRLSCPSTGACMGFESRDNGPIQDFVVGAFQKALGSPEHSLGMLRQHIAEIITEDTAHNLERLEDLESAQQDIYHSIKMAYGLLRVLDADQSPAGMAIQAAIRELAQHLDTKDRGHGVDLAQAKLVDMQVAA